VHDISLSGGFDQGKRILQDLITEEKQKQKTKTMLSTIKQVTHNKVAPGSRAKGLPQNSTLKTNRPKDNRKKREKINVTHVEWRGTSRGNAPVGKRMGGALHGL
jgi:hypothetical protein